jgi:hypothetical protein
MNKEKQMVKLDAQETIFFLKELESVKSKTYDKKYPELKMRSLIPVSNEAGPGANTIKYFQYDMVGVAKIIESYAKDFPRVNVRKKEFRSPVKSLGDSYGYSIQDIREAQMTGASLEQREANAARRAMMQKEDEIAAFGDAETGLLGLFNHPNIPETVLPADGTGSSKLWADKTPDQIIRDMNLIANSIVETTNGVEVPNTILLPIEKYTLIASKPRSNDSDTTILEFFLKSNPFIQNVDHYYKLKGAGASATDRMFCYKRDPDAVTLEVPVDFEQFPPQEEGMEFVVYCHQRIGGVIMYYPLSASFADGL